MSTPSRLKRAVQFAHWVQQEKVLIVSICVAFVAQNLLFVMASGTLYPGVYFAAATEESWALLDAGRWGEAFRANAYYPPFYYGFLTAAGALAGRSYLGLLAVTNLFFLAGLLAVYWLGRRLQGPSTGLLAAWLLATCPAVTVYGKTLSFEAPLFAFVALTYVALFQAGAWEVRSGCLWLGAVVALGFFTKWTYLVFSIGPLGLAALEALIRPRLGPGETLSRARASRIKNIAAFTLLPFFTNIYWYAFRLEWDNLALTTLNDPSHDHFTYAVGLAFYVREIRRFFTTPLTAAFVVACVLVVRKYGYRAAGLLVGAVVVPVLFQARFVHQEIRYLLPLFVSLCLVTALGVGCVGHRRTRAIVTGMLVALSPCFTAYHTLHNAIHPQPRGGMPGEFNLYDDRGRLLWQHSDPDGIARALEELVRSRPQEEEKVRVAAYPMGSATTINEPILRYALIRSPALREKVRFVGFEWTSVRAFIEAVKDEEIDVLLMPQGMFDVARTAFVPVVQRALDYVEPGSGQVTRGRTTPPEIEEDPGLRPFIQKHFQVSRVFEAGSGDEVLFMEPR